MKARIAFDPLFWIDLRVTRKGVEVTVWSYSALHKVVYPTTLNSAKACWAFARDVVPGFKEAQKLGRVKRYRVPQAA